MLKTYSLYDDNGSLRGLIKLPSRKQEYYRSEIADALHKKCSNNMDTYITFWINCSEIGDHKFPRDLGSTMIALANEGDRKFPRNLGSTSIALANEADIALKVKSYKLISTILKACCGRRDVDYNNYHLENAETILPNDRHIGLFVDNHDVLKLVKNIQ